MKKYLYIVIGFIFLNALKSWIIENMIISEGFDALKAWVFVKFLLYMLFNVFVFFYFIKFKKRFWLILFYILQCIYLFLHLAYFLYFKEIFNIQQVFLQFSEGAVLIKHLAVPKNIKYFIVLLDLPALVLTVAYFNKFYKYNKINLRRIFFFFLMIFILYSSLVINPVESYRKENFRGGPNKVIVSSYGLFALDILRAAFFKFEEFEINSLRYGNKVYFKGNKNLTPNNIICIQVETLDANIINYKYNGEYVAPFLHDLTSKAVYYPYMIMYRSIGATSDTEFIAINSLIPPSYYPSYRIKKYDYPNSILKRLSGAGYDALAFHSYYGDFFDRKQTFRKMGFRYFYDMKDMDLKESGWGAKDEDMFNFVKDKLKTQKQPFMYYIITMSSHEPFKNVRLYYSDERYNGIKEKIIKDYFNAISYVDRSLKEFVSFAKDMPNTYIFIFGDHAFYEINHVLFRPCAARSYRNNHVVATPLFIIKPDNNSYIENNRAASILDLGPTILYASGVSFEVMAGGIDLLDIPIRENQVFLRYDGIGNRRDLFKIFKNTDVVNQ